MPMDDETRAFLRGAYQYLEIHQKTINQVMIVTFALQKALQELGPEAAQLYAKHYQAQMLGPLKSEGDEGLKDLSRLVQQLSDAGESS